MILECGDFNAHPGEEVSKFSFHKRTNENGSRLLEHVNECKLRITNSMFQKRKGKQWTYISDMNGNKTLIDYILINRKWKNSVHNTEAYNTFSSCGSDHRLLTARIKLSLRMSKAPPKKPSYDYSVLRNPNLQHEYTVSVRNRYEELVTGNENATEKYGKFIEANAETAEQLLPRKKRTKPSIILNDQRIVEARSKVQLAFANIQLLLSQENQQKLKECKNNLKSAYDVVMEEVFEKDIKRG